MADKWKTNPFAKKYHKKLMSSHEKALTKMVGKGNVLKGKNIEGSKSSHKKEHVSVKGMGKHGHDGTPIPPYKSSMRRINPRKENP